MSDPSLARTEGLIYTRNEIDYDDQVYSPVITAEMMGLPKLYVYTQQIPQPHTKEKVVKQKPKEIMGFMFPSGHIMQAMSTFIPRAFTLMNNTNSIDESMVHKDSKIRHLFDAPTK